MKTYTITVNGKAYAVTVEEGHGNSSLCFQCLTAQLASSSALCTSSSSSSGSSTSRRSRFRSGYRSNAR